MGSSETRRSRSDRVVLGVTVLSSGFQGSKFGVALVTLVQPLTVLSFERGT